MPYDIDTEPVVIKVASFVALPAGNVSAAEWAEYKSRVAAVESLGIDDLTDVEVTTPSEGDILRYRSGQIVNEPLESFVTGVADSSSIDFGMTGGIIEAAVIHGGTGTAPTVARSDHTHAQPAPDAKTFTASGSLSGGTRSLYSGPVTGLDAAKSYTIQATATLDLRGEGTGAGYHVLSLTIAGSTVARSTSRTVSGVDREVSLMHSGVVVSGVTSVVVSASLAYDSGDPVNVGAGRIVVNVKPWR